MLEIKNLFYEREDALLVNNLSFTLKLGDFLYISGDNGKGKTTLLKLLAGILRPISGNIFWNNQSIYSNNDHAENFYRNINYIGHKSAIALPLTPTENLYFSSRAYSIKNNTSIDHALLDVDLFNKKNTPATFLSAGQIRRIALAKLFLLDTPLWLLDEPYTALDKKGIVWLKKHIQVHLEQKGMVIMTSHQDHNIKAPYIQEIFL